MKTICSVLIFLGKKPNIRTISETSLIAHTSNKDKITIAERLTTKPEAKLLREIFEGYFQNLTPAN